MSNFLRPRVLYYKEINIISDDYKMRKHIEGLIAASLTGFHPDGSVNLDIIPGYAAMLQRNVVVGVFVNGTTGEGPDLTLVERKALAEKWVETAPKGLRVIIHVGYADPETSRALAEHAADIGAYAIGEIGPMMNQTGNIQELVDYTTATASVASELPYYYYHMPSINGLFFHMIEFLQRAEDKIPNLAGIKYTHNNIDDYQSCKQFMDGKYDILFGRDEYLIDGLKVGARGSVGSTFNIMALLSIAYTVMGGIEAVIWTDVIQVIVLLGGACLVLLIIPSHIEGGFGGMIDLTLNADKLRLFDFHFNFRGPTFWVHTLGGIGANLISYGSDQTVIQRYMTTRNETEAARGIWTNTLLKLPASIIFFGLGSALFSFFRSNPGSLDISMKMTDAIFPWYIATQLPAVIAGLLIAGIFAAAMSSLDSSMNSVATAFTTDFYRRFRPYAEDRLCLKVARIVTIVIGIYGMCFALAMATWDIQSLWTEFSKYIGLFGGGLGGLFILAIFTRRANSRGAMIGLLASAILQYFLQATNTVHGVMFTATGMISCVFIGYLASLVTPGKIKDLSGLTLYSLNHKKG